MNFKNLFVSCSSSNEANKVISIGLKLGYKRHGANENLKNVIFTASGLVFDYGEPYENKYKKMSFIDFISQYETSTLKEKIEEAKKVTGLSASALSEKLGFQHKYLTNAVREASTQRQKEITAKLDGLIFKEKNELTHDFEGKALNVNIDDAIMVSKSEYDEMHSKNTALCVEVDKLKKELDHKNQVLDKRNDINRKLELDLKDKDELQKKLDFVSKRAVDDVKNLEDQLKATQEKFADVVDQKDKEIGDIKNQLSKKQDDFWIITRENATLINKSKDDRVIALIIVVILTAILFFKSL